MILGEMKAYLEDVVFRRSDVDALIASSLERAHHQIQMDGDWRACETFGAISFPSTATNGATLPSDYRSARHLLLLDEEGGSVVGEIQPSTESEVQTFRLDDTQSISGLDLRHNRWFLKGATIHLMLLPATGDTAIETRLEYFKLFDFYADDAAEDVFSQLWWPVLCECASWLGMSSIYEDERAALFKQRYDSELSKAMLQERRWKRGGTATVVDRPLPGSWKR